MFLFSIIIAFICGIFFGMPTAKIFAPPSIQTLFLFLLPWMILYMFSNDPLINDIRYIYLSWMIGVFCYWTYFESIKKIKGG